MSANPAIDVRLRVPRLEAGSIQRAEKLSELAGGKAAHVALTAWTLSAPALLVGWFGGATGALCQRQLSELAVPTLCVPTKSETRRNLEIWEEDSRVTELLEPGGRIEPSEVDQLLQKCTVLLGALDSTTILVLSGSLPPGAPLDLFAQLVKVARRHGITTIVDTSGEALKATLEARPDWVKPNHQEASELLGRSVEDAESALSAAHAIRARGATGVIVSRGRHGLVAVDRNRAFEARGPVVEARSSVGCGDAAVAGLAAALLRGAKTAQALKLAVACGTANCFAPSPGRPSAADIEQALGDVEVAELLGGAN